MPNKAEIKQAIINADAAGDVEAVKMLVAEFKKFPPDLPSEGTTRQQEVARREQQREQLGVGDILSSAGDAFVSTAGERIGLDPETQAKVHKNLSFLTPVANVGAAAGDILAGSFSALNSIGGDILFKTGLVGDDGRQKIKAELGEFVSVASLPLAAQAPRMGGTPSAAAQVTKDIRPLARAVAKKVSPVSATKRVKEATDRALVKMSIGGTSPKEVANKLVNDALVADKVNPQSITAGNLIQKGGENIRALARSSGSQIGESRNIIEAYKTKIVGQQFDRIRGAAEKTLGRGTGFFDEFEDLIKARTNNSAQLYVDAFDEVVPVSKELKTILNRPSGRAAIARARKLSAEGGEAFPNIFGKGLAQGKKISVRDLDKIKRGLDDTIEKFRDPVTGRLPNTNNVRSLEQTRAEFLGKIEGLSPTYKEARSAFSGPSQSLDALQRGRQFMRRNPEKISGIVKNMAEGDREFYRSGVLRGLLDEMDRIGANKNLVRDKLTAPRFRNQMRAVFDGKEKAADNFVDQLIKERERFNTAQFVSARTGSQTEIRGADKSFFGKMFDLMDLSGGNNFSVARRAVAKVKGRGAEQAQQEVFDEVARILTSEIVPPK